MTSSADDDSHIDRLISIASRLIKLMEDEVALLDQLRPGDIAPLQAEKRALAAHYETLVVQVATDPATLAALEPVMREEVAALLRRFDRTVTRNRMALEATREAHERLLKAIVNAVAETRAAAGYSPRGMTGRATAGKRTVPVSLALNRRL